MRWEWVNNKLEGLAIPLPFLEKLWKPFFMRSQWDFCADPLYLNQATGSNCLHLDGPSFLLVE
jgi:hypothetical protein